MKTLCAVVVVLSLVSVCRPAPLTCEKLVKPVDKGPDLTGRWYYIALSTKVRLVATLLNGLFWPSVSEDFTSTDIPNIYSGMIKFKMFDYCFNDTGYRFYANNSIIDVDIHNIATGYADVLLHTSCPDCIIVKSSDVLDSLILLSRRKVITDAEMKEFELQTRCFGWSEPQVLNTDFDYENCRDENDIFDDDASDLRQSLLYKMYDRLKSLLQPILPYLFNLPATTDKPLGKWP